MTDENDAKQVEQLLEMPNLADALESDRFKHPGAKEDGRDLTEAITDDDDYIGEFTIQHADDTLRRCMVERHPG